MNRAERRNLMKQGASKKTVSEIDQYNSPCTLAEAVQISRAAAEDVIADYHRSVGAAQLATAIQVDLLKNILIEKGILDEEEFKSMYIEQARAISDMQKSPQDPEEVKSSTEMPMNVNDLEITKEN